VHTSARNKRGEASGKTRLSVAAKAVRIKSHTPTERGREGERERLITSAPGRDSAMLGSPARTLLMLGSTRDNCGNDGGVASLKSKSTANSSEAALLLSLGAEALAGATGAWRPAVQGKEGCGGPSFLCPMRAEVVEEMMVSALLGAHHKVEERLSHSHLNLESGARNGSDRQKRILTEEKEEEGEGSRAVQGSGREGKGIVDRSKGVRGKGSSGGGGGSSSDTRVDSREQHILGDQWISYFKQLKSYRAKHGHFSVNKGEKRSPNFRLGCWVRCVCIFCLCVGVPLRLKRIQSRKS
jgi:hypothetical protein